MSVLSQCEFSYIRDEVHKWYETIESESTITSKAAKSFEVSAQHYYINGVVSKGILQEGSIVKFYEISSLVPNLLLEGKVSYQVDRLVVDGVKYINTSTGICKIYGSFYVYNMDDFSMNYKAKKAGALRMKCVKASYLEGFYLKCPVVVKLNGIRTIYVDGKTGGRNYSFFSAVIPSMTLNDDDSFDIYRVLLQAKYNVNICCENGEMFSGSVLPTIVNDTVRFLTLEGQKKGMIFGPKKITVSRENGNIVYVQEDDENNQILLKETLFVRDDNTLSEKDYWNLAKIYEYCNFVKWEYRNGNYFEGKVKSDITIDSIANTTKVSSTPTNGIFIYSNGDRFMGDFMLGQPVGGVFLYSNGNSFEGDFHSGQPAKGVFSYSNGDKFDGDLSKGNVGPFFTEGETYLKNGTNIKGNWLDSYKLSNEQWEKVYECQNPSSAMEVASNFMIENEKEAKQKLYRSLVDSIKSLGETPYQKALISFRDKYLEKFKTECWISSRTIFNCIMMMGFSDGIINQYTVGTSFGPVLLEAATNRPMTYKSIVSEMEAELKRIERQALPVEIEFEKLQAETLSPK